MKVYTEHCRTIGKPQKQIKQPLLRKNSYRSSHYFASQVSKVINILEVIEYNDSMIQNPRFRQRTAKFFRVCFSFCINNRFHKTMCPFLTDQLTHIHMLTHHVLTQQNINRSILQYQAGNTTKEIRVKSGTQLWFLALKKVSVLQKGLFLFHLYKNNKHNLKEARERNTFSFHGSNISRSKEQYCLCMASTGWMSLFLGSVYFILLRPICAPLPQRYQYYIKYTQV